MPSIRKSVLAATLLIFLAFLLLAEQVTAQQNSDIQLGVPVSGLLTSASPTARYTLTTSAGETVSITATSNDFDTLLSLQDASGNELASDDDSAGNLNSRIQGFTLPGSGSYTIVVKSAGGVSAGNFTLLAETATSVEPTAVPTASVTAGTISLGQSLSGSLAGDQNSAAYTFEGEVGQPVTIRLSSSDFDTNVTLSNSKGVVTSDDDSGGNLNAAIENFELPATDTYTITVGSFDGSGRGSFTLSLESGVVVQPTPQATFEATALPAGNEITIGSSVSGQLQTGQPTADYTFQGEIGEVVTISLVSSDFDSYLRLKDPSGYELTTDDDSAGGLDARIAAFTLPSNGTYTISVETFDSRYGAYTLSLSEAVIEQIEYGQTINGALANEGDTVNYRFHGAANDVITIRLASPDFDTNLSLSDSSGTSLVTNDDGGGGGTNSFIGPYTLTTDGDYSILVSSYDSTATGRYALTLNQAALTPIAYGDTVQASFSSTVSAYYYSFEGSSGDIVNVTVDSGSQLNTSLLLNGPDGYQVAFDDDSGSGFNPEIFHQVLSSEGTYTLVLENTVPGDSGQVSLSLTHSAAPSLDEGPQEIHLSSSVTTDVVTFSGHAGETVLLTAKVINGGGSDSPSVTVTQSGADVASASGTTISGISLQFIVPADGPVNVEITDYGYSDGVSYRLSLERISS
jgi:uncharacterized protein YfaP (DUF2135 family)